jgi:hypothetical protein
VTEPAPLNGDPLFIERLVANLLTITATAWTYHTRAARRFARLPPIQHFLTEMP